VTSTEIDGGEGEPSRWNTLRALRVLKWAHAVEDANIEVVGLESVRPLDAR
jgi:hypothetical protein